MNTYRFCYSVDGVHTLLPLYVIVKGDDEESAYLSAIEKVRQTDDYVKMGHSFVVYKNK